MRPWEWVASPYFLFIYLFIYFFPGRGRGAERVDSSDSYDWIWFNNALEHTRSSETEPWCGPGEITYIPMSEMRLEPSGGGLWGPRTCWSPSPSVVLYRGRMVWHNPYRFAAYHVFQGLLKPNAAVKMGRISFYAYLPHLILFWVW